MTAECPACASAQAWIASLEATLAKMQAEITEKDQLISELKRELGRPDTTIIEKKSNE